MKRNFLEDLGLEKHVINDIMKAHGQAINELNNIPSAEEIQAENEVLQKQIVDLEAELEKVPSLDIEIDKHKTKIEGYKQNLLKIQIASEYNIPLGLADKIKGATEQELRADAEQLAGYAIKPKAILPLAQPAFNKSNEPYQRMIDELDR